jgi:hypothetical protein
MRTLAVLLFLSATAAPAAAQVTPVERQRLTDLCTLDHLPPSDAIVMAAPLTILGGSGSGEFDIVRHKRDAGLATGRRRMTRR